MSLPRYDARRALWIVAAGIALAALIVAGAVVIARQDSASIDGSTVTTSELDFATEIVRRDVENAGGSVESLHAAAFAKLQHDSALLALARQEGVSAYASISDVIADRDRENQQRAQAANEGGVIYGQVEYSLAQFYGKTMAELRTRTMASMLARNAPELRVSDADVLARLDDDQDAWGYAATTLELSQVHVPASAASMDAADLAGGIGVSPFEELGGPDAVRSRSDLALQSEAAAQWNPHVIEQLATAAVGDVIGPEPDHGGWTLWRVDAIQIDRAAALQTYGSRIRTVLTEEAFDRLLAERTAAQHVRLP